MSKYLSAQICVMGLYHIFEHREALAAIRVVASRAMRINFRHPSPARSIRLEVVFYSFIAEGIANTHIHRTIPIISSTCK